MALDEGSGGPNHLRSLALRPIVEALNGGQPEIAFQACCQLLANRPDDPALNELAANAAFRAGRYDQAAALARRSLSARPDHLATLTLLGRSTRMLGRYGDAAIAFGRAVDLQPERGEAAFLLCAALLQAGSPEATPMLNGLLARFPRDAAGWEEIGEVLLASGKQEAAVICLSRAAQTSPSFPLAMKLGLVLRELGRPAEAASVFGQAVALDARSSRAWFLLGISSQDQGDLPAAAAAYRAVLSIEPTLAEAAVNLGTVLQDTGDLDGAKAAYGRAVTIRPDTFSRVAQAMTTSPKGELWLDLRRLRRSLAG